MTDETPAKAKQNIKNKKEPGDQEHICRLKWFSIRHNEIIALAAIGSLIVTSILALLTYFSLAEVKRQRELTFRQFVMANRPSISISVIGKGLRINDELGFFDWRLKNEGGDVQDLRFKCILFTLKRVEGNNYSVSEFYIRNSAEKYLNRKTHMQFKDEIKNKNTLEIIKRLIENYNKIDYLGAYLRVDYSIPSDLTVDGIEKKDNRYTLLVWDHDDQGFELLKPELFESVVKQLTENKVISKPDQG